MTAGLEASVGVRLGSLTLDVELTVTPGETVAVLGPNGAGKSTLLRAIAGLTPLDHGRVVLDGTTLDDPAAGVRVVPERRPSAIVFQDYVLFPHLSVVDNVAFGLRCRGVPARPARASAREWLARVGLAGAEQARPGALSGGQAQRVALARALVTAPRLLLLDEPLSALDVATRAATRGDLRRHLAEHDGMRLLVTHDPIEAAALADRLVVVEAGRVVQSGSPAQLRERPRSRYVADLVGVNLFRGRAEGRRVVLEDAGDAFALTVADAGSGDVLVAVAPRAVALHRQRPGGTPRNVWEGTVQGVDRDGERARVRVGGPLAIVAEVTAAAVDELGLHEGAGAWVSVKATEIEVYPS